MKTNKLILICLLGLLSSRASSQSTTLGNTRPGFVAYVGWNGLGPNPGPLDIRNDFAQPINFFTATVQRMIILDGAGPNGGFVGIGNGFATPNQRLTVWDGNMNLWSATGNRAYMLSSVANPNDRVLWHNGDRTDIFVGVLAGNAGNDAGGTRSTFVGYRAGFSATNTSDCVFRSSNA